MAKRSTRTPSTFYFNYSSLVTSQRDKKIHLKERLARSYLMHSNAQEALSWAIEACHGRYNARKDGLYFDACVLVAEIYLALGENTEAEIYMDDLPPSHRSKIALPVVDAVKSSNRPMPLQSDHMRTLKRISGGKLKMSLKGHTSKAFSFAFSPDGYILASGSEDDTIKLWDLGTGKLLQTLKGHRNGVYSVRFSPGGETIASGSADKTIKLWNATTGKVHALLKGHESAVYSIDFSPDGRTIASASRDTTVRLWDAAAGNLKKTLSGHTDYVYSVVFSSDGVHIASGSYDKTVMLWNGTSGTLQRILKLSNPVQSVQFSPDNLSIAAACGRGGLDLWHVETGTLTRTVKCPKPVASVDFSPSGCDVISVCSDGALIFCSVETGKTTVLRAGGGDVSFYRSASFSPNGRIVASGPVDKDDGSVEIWDIEYT